MDVVNGNIKKYRKKRGMTLKEVANMLDVSSSFLSQIETGKITPSLSTLKKIATVLNTTVGKLLGEYEDTHSGPIVKENERIPLKKVGSGLEIWLLSHRDPYIQMEPAIFEFSEDGNTGDFSQHFGQEFIFILDGSLEIRLGAETYMLEKGDSFYFNSYVPHLFRNNNKGLTRILRVITPPLFG